MIPMQVLKVFPGQIGGLRYIGIYVIFIFFVSIPRNIFPGLKARQT